MRNLSELANHQQEAEKFRNCAMYGAVYDKDAAGEALNQRKTILKEVGVPFRDRQKNITPLENALYGGDRITQVKTAEHLGTLTQTEYNHEVPTNSMEVFNRDNLPSPSSQSFQPFGGATNPMNRPGGQR